MSSRRTAAASARRSCANADGVDVDAAAEALSGSSRWSASSRRPGSGTSLRSGTCPWSLAAAAGLLGVVLLGHALVVTVRRRGHDLALLRALGARPRRRSSSVLVMTVIIVGRRRRHRCPGRDPGREPRVAGAWRRASTSPMTSPSPSLVAPPCLPVALLVGGGWRPPSPSVGPAGSRSPTSSAAE